MKRVQCTRKLRLLVSSLVIAVLFSCQLAFATDETTDWYAVRGTNPFLLLHDNVAPTTKFWYLWHNRSNLPDQGVGLGYFSSGSYIFPFVVEQDAPVNTLYLAQPGQVGVNTNTPAEELHLVHPSLFGSASIRLEGRGFILIPPLPALPTPTTSWDLNGHITQFGVEDVTQGHEVFKIESGSGEDTLVLRRDGGVTSDWSGTHSGGDGLKNLMTLTANNADAAVTSDSGFALKNLRANFQWNFRTAESARGFLATKEGTGGSEFKIKNTTNDYRQVSMELGNGAVCTATGQWLNASSRDYKENIKDLSGSEVMAAFKQLKPVSYNFKKDATKKATIGFIAEDVPSIVATEDRKGLNSLEIVALLTKVVQEQQAQIEAQQRAISQLEQKFQTPQVALPPSATLTEWQPMNQQQVPGSL